VVSYTFWSPYLRRKGHRYLLDRRLVDLPEMVWALWQVEVSLRLLGETEKKRIKTNNHFHNPIFIKL
jgi:hypothetical protein